MMEEDLRLARLIYPQIRMGFVTKDSGERSSFTTDGNKQRGIQAVSWNIAGVKKIHQVWDWLQKYDIIALQETWLEKKDENKVMGRLDKNFEWKTKEAVRVNKKGRAIGGQIVGLRKDTVKKDSIVEWKGGLVIKGVRLTSENRKFTILTIYNNCGFRKLETDLEAEIINASERAEAILLTGDINARIGEEQGRVDETNEWGNERKSEDKVLNEEGKKLLNFCEKNGLLIMNGRSLGDREGNLTFVGDRDGSVIDFVLVSDEEQIIVNELKIVIRTESDHLPISLNLGNISKRGGSEQRRCKETLEKRIITKKLVWNEENAAKYQEALAEEWEVISEVEGVKDKWDRIVKIIEKAAEKTEMIKKFSNNSQGSTKYCQEIKEQRKLVWESLKNFLNTRREEEKESLKRARRDLKKLKKDKERERWEEKWKSVEDSKNMSEMWKALRPFRPRKTISGNQVCKEDWLSHFKNLLGASERQESGLSQCCNEMEEEIHDENEDAELQKMNRDIEWTEMLETLKNMKNGKAAGKDGITIEFLKAMPEEGLRELYEILGLFWKESTMARGWEVGRIFPIHKAGDVNAAANYRGISLLNTGYKLLTNIMTKRLSRWIESNNLLKESQAGFRVGRGTRDHIFVLNALINNRLKRKGGKLYTAFVDFKAAFDSIDRNLLLEKLKKLGVKGRMLKMIEYIYGNTLNEVIASDGVTESFRTEKGVRQGCPLSPLLFNVFIEDIDEIWQKKNEGGSVIGKEKIFALKFADDIVLVSDDGVELGSMIATVEKYVDKNKLTINIGKTKVLIFQKGGRKKKNEKWRYKNADLEIVNDYKYLGVWFSSGNTFEKHITKISGKINKAINVAWGIFKRARIGSLGRRLNLMQALARSGLLYGVEIWGWRPKQRIDRLHAKYVKMAMGLSRNTPNYIWRLEAGQCSIAIDMWKRASRYLLEVLQMGDERWPKICLKEEIRGILNRNPSKWGKEMQNAMASVGEGRILNTLAESDTELLLKILERAIIVKRDQEVQLDWVKVGRSKYCEEYKNRKNGFEMEEYWENVEIKPEHKETWARLRCGNIGKSINKGFRDISCSFCKKEDENLIHVFKCKLIREKIKDDIVVRLDEWLACSKDGEIKCKIEGSLKRKPVVVLCEYVKEFERLKGKERENGVNETQLL